MIFEICKVSFSGDLLFELYEVLFGSGREVDGIKIKWKQGSEYLFFGNNIRWVFVVSVERVLISLAGILVEEVKTAEETEPGGDFGHAK